MFRLLIQMGCGAKDLVEIEVAKVYFTIQGVLLHGDVGYNIGRAARTKGAIVGTLPVLGHSAAEAQGDPTLTFQYRVGT